MNRELNSATRLAAIGCALALLATGCSGTATTQPASRDGGASAKAAPSSAAPLTSTLPGAKSACGLKEVKTEGTLTEGPKAEWLPLGTAKAPKIEGQGPGIIAKDGYRSCFARTPTGALLYIANELAMTTDQAMYVKHRVRDTGSLATPSQTEPASSGLRVAGFKFEQYNAEKAQMTVAYMITPAGAPEPAYGSRQVQLIWHNGDWDLDPSSPQTDSQVANLDGFVPWNEA